MKKILYLFGVLSFALVSCQEVNDLVQLTPPATDILALDSTYNSTPIAQPKNVLIEDFTGVHCDNCPNAQKQSVAIEDANPGRISVIGVQCTQTFGYPFPGHPDYRTANGTSLVDYLFGGDPSSLPTGDIDRKVHSFTSPPSIQVPYALWPFYVDSELTVIPNSSIAFSNKSYDSVTRLLTMEITTSFVQSSANTYFMSAAVIEGGFKDWQETTTGVDSNFVFEHVLRKLMNPATGYQFAVAPKSGATYRVKLTTILDPSWNADSCKVVAFVHQRSTTSNVVDQVQQTTVTP